MKHLFPALTGLCFLLSACSSGTSSTSGDDGAAPSLAGSAGNGGGANSGGNTGTAGATSSAAGTDASAGTTAAGGATAVGGASSGGGRGGSGAVGGDSSSSGGGGSSGQGGGAASGIDFSIWSLQLPTGSGTSPTTISPSKLAQGYTDAYFYVAADGGQAFMDPQTGIATSGSAHCRTEMREDNTDGSQAGWASSGTNTMTVTGEVVKVGGGSSGDVTVGQVFNGSDSIPLCELQYSNGSQGFKLFYEEAKGGGGSPMDLKVPVALSTKYTFVLSLSSGVLTATINGKQVYTHTPSAGILAKSFYFKFGAYDQTASAGAISTTPYTVVEAFSVDVVHK